LEGLTVTPSKWKQQLLRAKPQPDTPHRAKLGEAIEDGPDGSADGFVRIQADLAILFAPDQPDWQAAPEFAACCFVANAAIQPRTQDVEFSFLCRPPDYADLGVRSGYRVMGLSQV
jgi:hypothetical protein